MGWTGAEPGFGTIRDLRERVEIYRGIAGSDAKASDAHGVTRRLPDFSGASQRSPQSDIRLTGPCGRIVERRGAIDADSVSNGSDASVDASVDDFADDFAGVRQSSQTKLSSVIETLRRDLLTPGAMHRASAAQACAEWVASAEAHMPVSSVPALPGDWCNVVAANALADVGCWQFDSTVAFRETVECAPRALPAVLSKAVAPAAARRMGLPTDFPIVCQREFRYEAGHLKGTTEWRDACRPGRALMRSDEDFGTFPYPACVSVNFRGDAEGLVVIPVEIAPEAGEPPVTLLFSSPYGQYLGADGQTYAMTFVGDASYAFAMPPAEDCATPVVAHRALPGGDADRMFRLADRIMGAKMEITMFVSRADGPGWAYAPGQESGARFNLKWVVNDAGLARLFTEAGEELTQQLDTMLHVLNDPCPALIRLYRNFVPDDAHAQTNARRLVALHGDTLARNRSALETTFRRLNDMAAIADFQPQNGASARGLLLGMTTGSLADVPMNTFYDVPLILIARHLVQNIFTAQGTHAANVAGHHFADILFHECGHAAIGWKDDVTPQPWAYKPAHEFRGVYLREEWRGGTVDLAPLVQTLRQSTPESIVNLASFNQLMRMLLPALDAGLAQDVFPGLLDGTSANYSYEYLVSMLSEPHDRARFDADFLAFLNDLARQGRNIAGDVY
ncbi:hypothetical protein [Pandoraea anhela]|uniref:Uncharacterized protein n=1 Tax=Pandoraea anhela TaxID=2508295 RepID=A0A5E4V0R3_9BURK|nr:hypothetical protein [Pandoraea anhela]VVE05806.1 hypothetical protein PAN31108_02365 [Pandoraea anhela]